MSSGFASTFQHYDSTLGVYSIVFKHLGFKVSARVSIFTLPLLSVNLSELLTFQGLCFSFIKGRVSDVPELAQMDAGEDCASPFLTSCLLTSPW